MAGDKIRYAKQAANYVIDQLTPQDYVSIVIYDHEVNVIQTATPVRNKNLIKAKIDAITDRGNTNLMGGALEGYQQVQQFYNASNINRVLLLSDGLANQGITNPTQIRSMIQSKTRNEGISISTFGVGLDYNEDLMTTMAEHGAGNYYFIGKPGDIPGIFARELNALNESIAMGASLKITLPESVNVEQVYGQSYEQHGRTLNVHMQNLFAKETKGILIRYSIQSGVEGDLSFSSVLNYHDADDEQSGQIINTNRCTFTSNDQVYQHSYNDWVSSQVALYESNEQLDQAMKAVDRGQYEEARELVKKNEDYIRSRPKTVKATPAVQQAKAVNEAYKNKLEQVAGMAADEIKYLQKDTKNSNYELRAKKK